MILTDLSHGNDHSVLLMLKSFFTWTFTLTVCGLVVGFPVVVLMVTGGALAAIALQAVLPMSAVLLVAGSLLLVNVAAILIGATLLTWKGIHPHDVRWLRWVNGEANPSHSSKYAACPLTCDRSPV